MLSLLSAGHRTATSTLARLCVGIVSALALTWLPMRHAHAQRHYEMIIPIAAGGSLDLMARAVSLAFSQQTGESVTPLNKVGAGTLLATRSVAQSTATDGRTLLFTGLPYTTLQYKKGGPAFDESRFKPVIYVGWQPTVLFIRSSIPANDMKSFLAWAKARPEGVTFASSGIGSSPHIAAEQFADMTGIKIVHVPMGGSSAFVPALAGGHVDAVFDAPATRTMVKEGYLKALMIGSDTPLADWKELPTSDQAGLPGFRSGTWYGVLVPAGTPDTTVSKLNTELNKSLTSQVVQSRAREFGITLSGGAPQAFNDLLKSEHERIGALVKTRGIVIP
ncbi:Bug family tripartite tricarboxylate transporter substrate binding protein [Candidimonas nitroreducens]|nr:tripartite tricarboxylate transporter substrate binding protein [Candidimonas nitroreducens]